MNKTSVARIGKGTEIHRKTTDKRRTKKNLRRVIKEIVNVHRSASGDGRALEIKTKDGRVGFWLGL